MKIESKPIGTRVTINNPASDFNKKTGAITEIVEDSFLAYTVTFDNPEDGFCYFNEGELE